METALKIISTAATLVIGIAASLLAYQQYRISKSKLKLDLYDRRLDIYKKARLYLAGMAWAGWNSEQVYKAGRDFQEETLECKFLFDEDVVQFIKSIHSKAVEFGGAKAEYEIALSNGSRTQVSAASKQTQALDAWYREQAKKLVEVFEKDLSIKTLR